MAERSEAPRDAARRIVEAVLAERSESVPAQRSGSGRGSEMVVAPSTSVEPLDEGSAAAAAADDPDDPRARARALVAEVLASRTALEAPATPSPDEPSPPREPAAAASSARGDHADPSRLRARELVAAALADAERRAAEAETERAEAEAERERAAEERARREAERERRIDAERRSAERRAAAERDPADDDDRDGDDEHDAGAERVPAGIAATGPGGDEDGTGDRDAPPLFTQQDAGTTVPLSVAELAASVGADATADVSAEETHALPRHRDEEDGPPAAPRDERTGGDAEATVAIATRPHDPDPAPTPDPAPAPATTEAPVAVHPEGDEPSTREVPAPEPVEAAMPPTNEVPGPEWAPTYTSRDAPAGSGEDRPQSGPIAGGALEASVEVEPRPPQRRTGRWLLTSLLGAIALAVLFPLAVDALRALVAL